MLHWQTNEPGVFKQVALFKQDLCKHSSTSAKRKNNHFRNHILLLHFLSIRLMFFFNMTYQLHILFHPILADNYRCIGPHCSSSHRLHRSGKDCWYTSHLCKEIISEAVNFTNGRTQIKLINHWSPSNDFSSRSWHTFKWRAISVHKMCFYIVMDPSHTKKNFFLQDKITNFA